MQVKKIQELKHRQRAQLLAELRKAYISGKLQLIPNEMMVHELIEATRSIANIGGSREKKSEQTMKKYELLLQDFQRSSDKLPLVSKTPEATLRIIQQSVDPRFYQGVVAAVPVFPHSAVPSNRVADYDDWHWVSLLYK